MKSNLKINIISQKHKNYIFLVQIFLVSFTSDFPRMIYFYSIFNVYLKNDSYQNYNRENLVVSVKK